MLYEINETHDPKLQSWVESANDPTTDFPIQNLPFGVFYREDEDEDDARVGVAIGDQVLDLSECLYGGLFTEEDDPDSPLAEMFESSMLNFLMEESPDRWSELRRRISELLSEDCEELRDDEELRRKALVPMDDVVMCNPAEIGNYTDFYASVHHATNVGSMFRPDNPLLPNYKWIPIAYHGRASSVVVSGEEVVRPCGQLKQEDADPAFGPCKLLDYELEVGIFIGEGNERGERIEIDEAEENIFGMCLVNDWSARDIQKWEYQPLGPFLAKSFATTVSPWVVTMEALAPFRCPAFDRPSGDPHPLPYLHSPDNQTHGGVDLTLEVLVSSEQMRNKGMDPMRLSRGNFKSMYWTIAQMVTHHASNGCNLDPGDLLASGTVSGESPDSRGCMLELTWDAETRSRKPIELPTGETRTFLEDGDEVIIRGYCEREGYRTIGFGECRGIISPAGEE